MDKKSYESEVKRLETDLDKLRSARSFDGFLISMLTMKAFYPETWYKSYNVNDLLVMLDYHIERISKTSESVATPVGLGAMDIIYHDHVDGQKWPTYSEILGSLKNDIIMNWDGVPVKRKTVDDINEELMEAERSYMEEKAKNK